MSKKAIVAFSGGLDTSMLVPYICEKHGFETVVTCTVNTGGFDDREKEAIAQRSREIGSSNHVYIDASQAFYDEIIKYLIFGNVSRDGYPLCVGAERLIQAREVLKIAREKAFDTIVHGSTGAGNDQYRFDLVAHVLGQADGKNPAINILAPIRDESIKREYSQDFLRERNIKVSQKSDYSYNVGLWGVSIGGKETHTAQGLLPENAWYTRIDPARGNTSLVIRFENGQPVQMKADDKEITGPINVIRTISAITGSMGIGRHYHVGTSIPGKKGRLGYESPAADVLYEAHSTLEKLVMTQEQIFFKKQVANAYGRLIHEAKFFDPLLDDLKAFLESSQKRVTGTCTVYLKPARIEAVTVETPYDLLSGAGSVYGEHASFYTPEDARGAAKISSYEQVIYQRKQVAG